MIARLAAHTISCLLAAVLPSWSLHVPAAASQDNISFASIGVNEVERKLSWLPPPASRSHDPFRRPGDRREQFHHRAPVLI